jgi:hypothetical protein
LCNLHETLFGDTKLRWTNAVCVTAEHEGSIAPISKLAIGCDPQPVSSS